MSDRFIGGPEEADAILKLAFSKDLPVLVKLTATGELYKSPVGPAPTPDALVPPIVNVVFAPGGEAAFRRVFGDGAMSELIGNVAMAVSAGDGDTVRVESVGAQSVIVNGTTFVRGFGGVNVESDSLTEKQERALRALGVHYG